MTLEQAEAYLLDLELFGMRFGLDRVHRLMTVLGLPQRRFASIHVVGSNGKSSTTRMIAAILERHGVRTGTYTSPHLVSFRERVEVREQPLPAADFASAVAAAARAAELVDAGAEPDDRVTQFEALTAAAYHALGRARVEVAVIEAGLGGRYDATNVIPSRVQVLTGIGLEHTRWLGPELADIAEEKLAVVRDHGLLVSPELPGEVDEVAERVALERHARRVVVRAGNESGLPPLRARGAFQRRNFALARAASEAFLGRLDSAAVARAAAELELPGRLQAVSREPLVLLDGAHNPDGALALAEALPVAVDGLRPLVLVISILDDKDARAMLATLLPRSDVVVATRSHHPRSLSPEALETAAREVGSAVAIELIDEPASALERARELAGSRGAVVVTGSLYLVGDVLAGAAGRVRASSL